MSRSKQEIEFEIRWLTKNKPKIPQRTGFGDDNHAAIEAQIAALVEEYH